MTCLFVWGRSVLTVLILPHWQSKHYGSVLVHCVKGVSRSASFVLG